VPVDKTRDIVRGQKELCEGKSRSMSGSLKRTLQAMLTPSTSDLSLAHLCFTSVRRCSLASWQRGLSEQLSKHAPFCIKGATTLTSIHQIEPNLASHCCYIISHQGMCSDLVKLPCERNDRTYCNVQLCTGTLIRCSPWEMVHTFAYLPTTCSFCSICFAMILVYYKD
jgi:hypothetical protein